MCDPEKLIEIVRGQPILYDLSHSEYKNIKKKERQNMGRKLPCLLVGRLVTLKKWKNLPDSHSKYLRTEKTKTGQEMKILDRYKTWLWAQQMEFLRTSLSFAKTHSNILSAPCQQLSKVSEEGYKVQSSQQTVKKCYSSVENIHPLIDDSQQQRKKSRQPDEENQKEKKTIDHHHL